MGSDKVKISDVSIDDTVNDDRSRWKLWFNVCQCWWGIVSIVVSVQDLMSLFVLSLFHNKLTDWHSHIMSFFYVYMYVYTHTFINSAAFAETIRYLCINIDKLISVISCIKCSV